MRCQRRAQCAGEMITAFAPIEALPGKNASGFPQGADIDSQLGKPLLSSFGELVIPTYFSQQSSNQDSLCDRDSEASREVVVTGPSNLNRTSGTRVVGFFSGSESGHRFEQVSDPRVGDPIISMTTLRNDLEQSTLSQFSEMRTRGLTGNSSSLSQFGGRQASPVEQGDQNPTSRGLADQRSQRGNIRFHIYKIHRLTHETLRSISNCPGKAL